MVRNIAPRISMERVSLAVSSYFRLAGNSSSRLSRHRYYVANTGLGAKLHGESCLQLRPLGAIYIGCPQKHLQLARVNANSHPSRAFRTSASNQAPHDSSTIDFFFFPELSEPDSANPFSKLRVPLLLDTISGHAADTPDEALPRPEISIVAGHLKNVAPAALSEVVGNDAVDVDIDQLTAGFSASSVEELRETGILLELWSGMIDDLFGSLQDFENSSTRNSS